jgi:hypothetical protein
MENVTVGIRGKLTRDGASEIDLLVHSYYLGRSSPCVVIENWVNRGLIGGHIENLDEIFQLEVAKHPGYIVQDRMTLVATTDTDPDETANERDTHRDTQ